MWTIIPDINWTRDSGSGNNRCVLSIYENVLQPGTVYNVSAQGEIELSYCERKKYIFVTFLRIWRCLHFEVMIKVINISHRVFSGQHIRLFKPLENHTQNISLKYEYVYDIIATLL